MRQRNENDLVTVQAYGFGRQQIGGDEIVSSYYFKMTR